MEPISFHPVSWVTSRTLELHYFRIDSSFKHGTNTHRFGSAWRLLLSATYRAEVSQPGNLTVFPRKRAV